MSRSELGLVGSPLTIEGLPVRRVELVAVEVVLERKRPTSRRRASAHRKVAMNMHMVSGGGGGGGGGGGDQRCHPPFHSRGHSKASRWDSTGSPPVN